MNPAYALRLTEASMSSESRSNEARSGPDSEGTTSLDGKVNRLFSIVRTSMLFFFAILPVALHGQNAMPFAAAADSFLYIKVQLEPSIKPASLKPGDLVEGKLIRSVY